VRLFVSGGLAMVIFLDAALNIDHGTLTPGLSESFRPLCCLVISHVACTSTPDTYNLPMWPFANFCTRSIQDSLGLPEFVANCYILRPCICVHIAVGLPQYVSTLSDLEEHYEAT